MAGEGRCQYGCHPLIKKNHGRRGGFRATRKPPWIRHCLRRKNNPARLLLCVLVDHSPMVSLLVHKSPRVISILSMKAMFIGSLTYSMFLSVVWQTMVYIVPCNTPMGISDLPAHTILFRCIVSGQLALIHFWVVK